MKISCQRCNANEAFEIPNFSIEEKKSLLKLINVSTMEVIMEIRKNHKTTLRDSKFIGMHINSAYKKCRRCSSELNDFEYTSCTKCGALNFNWLV